MTNQEILENAPEGATHVDEYGIYLNTENDSYWKETSRKWVELTELLLERNTRLLADIARIAELEKALATSFELLSMSQPADYWFYENHKHLIKEQGE
jgi:hypothetical protein